LTKKKLLLVMMRKEKKNVATKNLQQAKFSRILLLKIMN